MQDQKGCKLIAASAANTSPKLRRVCKLANLFTGHTRAPHEPGTIQHRY